MAMAATATEAARRTVTEYEKTDLLRQVCFRISSEEPTEQICNHEEGCKYQQRSNPQPCGELLFPFLPQLDGSDQTGEGKQTQERTDISHESKFKPLGNGGNIGVLGQKTTEQVQERQRKIQNQKDEFQNRSPHDKASEKAAVHNELQPKIFTFRA